MIPSGATGDMGLIIRHTSLGLLAVEAFVISSGDLRGVDVGLLQQERGMVHALPINVEVGEIIIQARDAP